MEKLTTTKPPKCTSDFIYIIDEDRLIDNVGGFREPKEPVDAHDLASMPVDGYYRVELARGSDLNEVSTRAEYDDNSWYIVGGQGSMMGVRLKSPNSVKKYEALISF